MTHARHVQVPMSETPCVVTQEYELHLWGLAAQEGDACRCGAVALTRTARWQPDRGEGP